MTCDVVKIIIAEFDCLFNIRAPDTQGNAPEYSVKLNILTLFLLMVMYPVFFFYRNNVYLIW